MTQLCIIRHGETDWNLQGRTQGSVDIPLNPGGRRQARAAAAYLAEASWDFIYASPLSRAYETAQIIASAVGLSELRTDPRLVERHFGEAEGMDVDERKQRFRGAPIPEAESWEAVRTRGYEAAREIVAAHPGKRIIAVAHGGLIGGLLSEISGGELQPGKPPLANCAMTLLEWDGRWRIRWFNRVASELEREPRQPVAKA